MNSLRFTSFIAASLLLLSSLFATAAELEGTVVSGSGSEVQSSLQSAQDSSVQAAPQPPVAPAPIKKIIQDEIRHEIPSFGYDSDFNEFVLIPIVSVIVVFGGGFAFVIYLVILRNRAAAQRRLQHQEQIQKFIDAGRDVPDILLRDAEGYSSQTNLAKGIKDTLIGLAIVVFLTMLVGFDIGAAGLIIVAAGLARIIIWKLTQDKNS
jgi:hypothetical protein